MSSNYTGDPTAAQAPSPPPGRDIEPVTTLPTDGDAGNAASVMQAFKVLADFVAWCTNHMPIKDDTNANEMNTPFRWPQAMASQIDDADHRLAFGYPTDNRQCIFSFQNSGGAGAQYAYLYQENASVGGGLSFASNAVWDQTTTNWIRTSAGVAPAMLFRIRGSEIRIGYVDGTAATWADSAWTGYAGLIPYAPLLGAPGNGLQSEGPVLIARDAGDTAWPTAQVTPGEIYRDFVSIGYYRALWTGVPAETVRCCANVKSVTRTGLGQYSIIFWPIVSNPAKARVNRDRYTLVGGERIGTTVQDAGGADAGRIQVNVSIWNESETGVAGAFAITPVDDEFEIEVKCKP